VRARAIVLLILTISGVVPAAPTGATDQPGLAVDKLRERSPETLTLDQLLLAYPDQVSGVADALDISVQDAVVGLQMQEPAGRMWQYLAATDPNFGGAWLEWHGPGGPQLVVGFVNRYPMSGQADMAEVLTGVDCHSR
jgi:hypothetical protein